MATYPEDRFDELPPDTLRVGAHRAPAKKGRGWIGFGWAALATVILTGAGLVGLAMVDSSINFDLPFFRAEPSASPSTTPSPTAEAVIDAEVPLSILNGTPTPGLANQVGDALLAQGWAGAAEGIGSRANAAVRDVEKTLVYYSDPSYEGAARGLVLALGTGDIRLSTDYPASPITVVIGLDYKPIQ